MNSTNIFVFILEQILSMLHGYGNIEMDTTSVLNIGYRRYIGRQNYIPNTEYRMIYRDIVLNTGRQIRHHTG